MSHPVLVWVRNDLRFHDNPAIFEAAARGQPVLLVYIYDAAPSGPSFPGSAARVWLEASLELFGTCARRKGFGWIIREGRPLDVLRSLQRETGASHIYWNRRYEPDALALDAEVKEVLEQEGLSVFTFKGNLLIEPWQLQNAKGSPFLVFTPFWQAFQCSRLDVGEAPEPYPAKPVTTFFESLSPQQLPLAPKREVWPRKILSNWRPGEEHALRTLEQFCLEHLKRYDTDRDMPAADVTSHLSPYLHFGEISVRRVWNMVLAYERNIHHPCSSSPATTFLRQLVWREFAHAVLFHFPCTVSKPFHDEFQHVPWQKDEDSLRAWQCGQTGIPIVDAGMRQLWDTGWIPNRVRMITASFLVKHLLHSWQEGMAWFWDTLIDANLANNTFNWQWVMGSGVDSAPYFRIFNPVIQGCRYDPEGTYVRTFLPELRAMPSSSIHAPWKASPADLASWGVCLGKTYPHPIIDIEEGRKRALQVFSKKK